MLCDLFFWLCSSLLAFPQQVLRLVMLWEIQTCYTAVTKLLTLTVFILISLLKSQVVKNPY